MLCISEIGVFVEKNTWIIASEPKEKMSLNQLQLHDITLSTMYALFFI